MKTIILIRGKKRAGKDTIAEKLYGKLPVIVKAEILSFAEPMKDILADTFEVNKETIEVAKNEPYLHPIKMVQLREDVDYNRIHTDMRRVLQNFGQAVKKHFGQAVWADLLYSKLEEDTVHIVSDWRYIIEYEALRDRPNVRIITLKVYDEDADNSDTHSSEVELDEHTDTTYTINNSKDHRKYVDMNLDEFIRKTRISMPDFRHPEPLDYFKCAKVW